MKIENKTLFLDGQLDKKSIPEIMGIFNNRKAPELEIIDLAELSMIDSAGVVFIDYLKSRYPELKIINVKEHIQHTILAFQDKSDADAEEPIQPGFFEKAGGLIYDNIEQSKKVMFLLSDIVWWSF